MSAIVLTLSKAKLLASVLWNPQLTEETHGQLSSNIFLRFIKKEMGIMLCQLPLTGIQIFQD